MSAEIPVFAFAAAPDQLREGMDMDEVLNLAPANLWMATSRNWWYQGLLSEVLEAYPGHQPLEYLLELLFWIPPQETLAKAAQIRALLSDIATHPEAFCVINYHDETPEGVRRQVSEAQTMRQLDDDCTLAWANFFSFLASQAAALEEAAQLGLGLIYAQPQPDHSPLLLSFTP